MSVVPDLWGIDPDEVYKWTPKAQREVLDKGKWNEKKREWDSLSPALRWSLLPLPLER